MQRRTGGGGHLQALAQEPALTTVSTVSASQVAAPGKYSSIQVFKYSSIQVFNTVPRSPTPAQMAPVPIPPPNPPAPHVWPEPEARFLWRWMANIEVKFYIQI